MDIFFNLSTHHIACDVPVNHWVSPGRAQLQATSSPWKAGTGYTCFGLWLQFLPLFGKTSCSFLGCPLRMCLPHSWPWSGVHAVRQGSTLDCLLFRGQQILQPGFALLLFLSTTPLTALGCVEVCRRRMLAQQLSPLVVTSLPLHAHPSR